MTSEGHNIQICGSTAALGTLHRKEEQIRAPLAAVGLRVVVEPIDTNRLGTFCGLMPRRHPPDTVAVQKAKWAARAASCEWGLGSEGSFFVHPAMPLIPTNLELVALAHRPSGLVVIGRSQQLAPWAQKGVDLRAHRCPERQPSIVAAASDLAARLRQRCPACDAPGVGKSRTTTGRPCSWCGGPTLELLAIYRACPMCDWEQVDEVAGAADPGACPTCNP